jgi:D-alanyl-D-alanine carboxypeptidase/D-alanyl-D-alanine-endopeptidase (penicillin-binding protein 4)
LRISRAGLLNERVSLILTALFLLFGVQLGALAQNAPHDDPPKLTRPTAIVRPVVPPVAPAPEAEVVPVAVAASGEALNPEVQSLLASSEGVLIETLSGRTLLAQNVDQLYNPASAVKLATALAALRTFGPAHRFDTAIWSTGNFDKASGTLTGDLIVSGRDPSFHYEHAVELAQELNQLGIRTVTGDLIIAPKFTLNFDWSAQRSGNILYDTLDVTRRPPAATRAWNGQHPISVRTSLPAPAPSVAVMGAVYVDSVPKDARMLLVHRSSKLVDILKVLLCYSNNFMAERVGDTLGGALGVRRIAISAANVLPTEISLSTASGLGVNRLTPHAMLKIYRALLNELGTNNLTPADILPVAGVDPGTLQKRYTEPSSRGSVIAKTGTLTNTDGGASALVGQMRTTVGEPFLFVIFHRGRNIWRARKDQDLLVSQLQRDRGGPAPFFYQPAILAMQLSDTQTNAAKAQADEFEPVGH